MQKKSHASEQGQVIVFLVIGLVVFLGFTALAIDGGMAYSDRRYAQNSSDAASLAGGGEAALILENEHVYYKTWSCNDPSVIYAQNVAIAKAIERALNNEFVIDTDCSDDNCVIIECGEEAAWGSFIDKYIDVTVKIATTTETSFAHLLYPDVINIRADSTTRVRPRQPWVFGNAIVSLNPDACSGHDNGGVYYGNGDVNVYGGGIWSNGCLAGDGRPWVTVDQGGIFYGGEFEPGNANWDPQPPDDPVDYQIPPSAYDVPIPDCTGRWVDNHDIPRNGDALEPGLYCFNTEFRANAHDEIIGNDVTFFIYGADITLNGNATIQLSAPQSTPDPSPAIPGVLFYIVPNPADAPCPDQTVIINGNSESYFQGLILAPCADISLLGTGSTDAYHSQVVGWNVLVGGEADTWVVFDEDRPEGQATRIELSH